MYSNRWIILKYSKFQYLSTFPHIKKDHTSRGLSAEKITPHADYPSVIGNKPHRCYTSPSNIFNYLSQLIILSTQLLFIFIVGNVSKRIMNKLKYVIKKIAGTHSSLNNRRSRNTVEDGGRIHIKC